TVRRDAIRLSGIALDHLANAFGVAGGRRLEHGELRPSPKYRRRDVVLAAIERRQDGREPRIVPRVDERPVPLQKPFHRGRVAALDRRKQVRRHQRLSPCGSLAYRDRSTLIAGEAVQLSIYDTLQRRVVPL